MIHCKRDSQCADVPVAIWLAVSQLQPVSPNNVEAIAWYNDYKFANIQYTMS